MGERIRPQDTIELVRTCSKGGGRISRVEQYASRQAERRPAASRSWGEPEGTDRQQKAKLRPRRGD